jgi:hypothetical protein
MQCCILYTLVFVTAVTEGLKHVEKINYRQFKGCSINTVYLLL